MKSFQFIFFFFQKGNCQISDNFANNSTLLTGVSISTGLNVLKCAKPNELSSVEVRDPQNFPYQRLRSKFPILDPLFKFYQY